MALGRIVENVFVQHRTFVARLLGCDSTRTITTGHCQPSQNAQTICGGQSNNPNTKHIMNHKQKQGSM